MEIQISLETVRSLCTSQPNLLKTSFNKIKAFLENSYGSNDPLSEAHRLTTNAMDIISDLQEIHPLIQDRALKSRITRICKKMNKQMEQNYDTQSQSSTDQEQDPNLSIENLSQESY